MGTLESAHRVRELSHVAVYSTRSTENSVPSVTKTPRFDETERFPSRRCSHGESARREGRTYESEGHARSLATRPRRGGGSVRHNDEKSLDSEEGEGGDRSRVELWPLRSLVPNPPPSPSLLAPATRIEREDLVSLDLEFFSQEGGWREETFRARHVARKIGSIGSRYHTLRVFPRAVLLSRLSAYSVPSPSRESLIRRDNSGFRSRYRCVMSRLKRFVPKRGSDVARDPPMREADSSLASSARY